MSLQLQSMRTAAQMICDYHYVYPGGQTWCRWSLAFVEEDSHGACCNGHTCKFVPIDGVQRFGRTDEYHGHPSRVIAE